MSPTHSEIDRLDSLLDRWEQYDAGGSSHSPVLCERNLEALEHLYGSVHASRLGRLNLMPVVHGAGAALSWRDDGCWFDPGEDHENCLLYHDESMHYRPRGYPALAVSCETHDFLYITAPVEPEEADLQADYAGLLMIKHVFEFPECAGRVELTSLSRHAHLAPKIPTL